MDFQQLVNAPAGMNELNGVDTFPPVNEWIQNNLNPTTLQIDYLLLHVFLELNVFFDAIQLTSRQKYAILRQGIHRPNDLTELGRSKKDVIYALKDFNTMNAASGRVNFGQAHYRKIWAMVYYVFDEQRRGRDPDPNAFDDDLVEEYLELCTLADEEADDSDDKDDDVKVPDLTDRNIIE